MTRYVVDASVVIKWFVPEVHTEAAQSLLREGLSLSSPDLVRAEVGNVLWKKWRRDEVSSDTVEAVLRDLGGFSLEIKASTPLLGIAWNVARSFDRSFYDSLYVALAMHTDCPLVTADRKLYNAFGESDLSRNLLWVEDLNPA